MYTAGSDASSVYADPWSDMDLRQMVRQHAGRNVGWLVGGTAMVLLRPEQGNRR